MEEKRRFLTMQEVADILRVNKVTVREMIRNGQLSAIRVGKSRLRISVKELEEFIDMQQDEKK